MHRRPGHELGIAVAYARSVFGGSPHDADRYGRIGVPGDERTAAQIMVGASPWTQFGSVTAGAALTFLVVFLVVAVPWLLVRRLIR